IDVTGGVDDQVDQRLVRHSNHAVHSTVPGRVMFPAGSSRGGDQVTLMPLASAPGPGADRDHGVGHQWQQGDGGSRRASLAPWLRRRE
ncbi:MAG: hypothetical protein ACRDPF_29185, partial [Streptosporangiaceae bacterium]